MLVILTSYLNLGLIYVEGLSEKRIALIIGNGVFKT